MPRTLDRDHIVRTLGKLRDRINERFPDSGLGRVCGELLSVADETSARVAYLAAPNWPIRIGVAVVLLAMLAVIVVLPFVTRLSTSVSGVVDFIQGAEAGVSILVFLGATVFFLVSLETRLKRSRALAALHQLRSIAHIVDMHQLTKDPEQLMLPSGDTASSPARTMSPVELGRYLDYCSEMLSLVAKLAALHVQHLNDAVVLAAVNDIEALASGLSNKIWQKITLLERVVHPPHA
ncbi:MAG TPA: hypothetical protein VJR92_01925 [Gemmatimonadaceae bacterium]|nr:hypothetical protein [Gemmatimonadaceae bacterium]